MSRDYAQRYMDDIVARGLAGWMRHCRAMNQSFDACLAEARKQFQRELREEALQPDRTPLTK